MGGFRVFSEKVAFYLRWYRKSVRLAAVEDYNKRMRRPWDMRSAEHFVLIVVKLKSVDSKDIVQQHSIRLCIM